MRHVHIGYYEITKAGDAVAALKKSLKPIATVKRDGKFANVDAALLVPGDLVLLGIEAMHYHTQTRTVVHALYIHILIHIIVFLLQLAAARCLRTVE